MPVIGTTARFSPAGTIPNGSRSPWTTSTGIDAGTVSSSPSRDFEPSPRRAALAAAAGRPGRSLRPRRRGRRSGRRPSPRRSARRPRSGGRRAAPRRAPPSPRARRCRAGAPVEASGVRPPGRAARRAPPGARARRRPRSWRAGPASRRRRPRRARAPARAPGPRPRRPRPQAVPGRPPGVWMSITRPNTVADERTARPRPGRPHVDRFTAFSTSPTALSIAPTMGAAVVRLVVLCVSP